MLDDYSCDNCRFWQWIGRDKENEACEYGMCRRLPPQIPTRQAMSDVYGLWPITREADWCGEFRMVEDEDSEGGFT